MSFYLFMLSSIYKSIKFADLLKQDLFEKVICLSYFYVLFNIEVLVTRKKTAMCCYQNFYQGENWFLVLIWKEKLKMDNVRLHCTVEV